jgi:alkanesulfonate monooxygenase SsuD/methylene tetrahydromethanopterin reductase-like flavin-dependent oxidoreductase (luciferase family)
MNGNGQTLGVSVVPMETRREAIRHIATTADRLGYDAFFLPEGWAYDSTVLLAELATCTRRIQLGSGILGIWGRTAATMAMAAATLHAVSGGRFILGLGASTAQLTEGLHDTPFDAPLTRLRRVLTQVRTLLRGERIPLTVTTGARALRLGIPAGAELPLYVAGLAPASVRLTGELADGWLPFLFPRSQLVEGDRLLREGAARTNPGRAVPICPVIPTAVGDTAAAARQQAAWFIVFYLTAMGELYRRILARLGYKVAVEALMVANAPRTPPIVPDDAEVLLEELTIFGTPDSAPSRLAGWYEAGASMPVLLLGPDLTPDQIDRTLEVFRGDRCPRGLATRNARAGDGCSRGSHDRRGTQQDRNGMGING